MTNLQIPGVLVFSSMPSVVSWLAQPSAARRGVGNGSVRFRATIHTLTVDVEEWQGEDAPIVRGAASILHGSFASKPSIVSWFSPHTRPRGHGGSSGRSTFWNMPSVVTWAECPPGGDLTALPMVGTASLALLGSKGGVTPGSKGSVGGFESMDAMKTFERTRANLGSEGDKQMGFCNAYILRSEMEESQLWYKERKNLMLAEEALRAAKASYQALIEFMTENGRLEMILDDNGRFWKQDAVDLETKRTSQQVRQSTILVLKPSPSPPINTVVCRFRKLYSARRPTTASSRRRPS